MISRFWTAFLLSLACASTIAIPTNVTSMVFYPLTDDDAYNQDLDNDGLPTIDELFFYNTDPRHPDSDYDGLTDYEELFVYHTDPLDPYSAGGPYSDGVTVKIGDLDPFAYPEGSTNTVLEHVFYSGTTNGAFAYPQSDNDTAILKVMVSGTGTGRLIVGDSVVPLVAPPQMRSSPPNPMPPLLVQIVKGETYPVYLREGELLQVSMDSADFAFGVLPTHNAFGHINFPNAVATVPCIHDFNARRKGVCLPMSRDAEGLSATWSGSADVSVSNIPPRSATVTGNFPARSTSGITYTLSHPQYLFGQTSYDQTVRFCPQPPDPDPEDPDPLEDPPWYSDGDGDDSDETDDDHDEHWCCYWGTCDGWCGCGCDCANQGGDPNPLDDADFDDDCPTHSCPYDQCAHLHEYDYTNAVQNVQHLGGVLYIREPPLYEQLHLDVPTEHRNCCPCPDHWTNYVGVAYKSYRLRLIDSNGLPFRLTETSCDVNLAGAHPSSAVGDATLAFSRNGEIYQPHNKTVLGVAIQGSQFDLAPYNALSSSFGYPMTVCTNLWYAPQMNLVTNVRLPDGKVHLELVGATGQFTVWYYDSTTCEYRKLLDTAAGAVKDLSMSYWKAMMRRAGSYSRLPIYITSSAPGTVGLKFRYWAVIDGKFVQDEATQYITSLRPPLLADMDGDGAFGDGDVSCCLDGRLFRFWMNEDFHKGDYIGQVSDTVTNTADMVVNGRLDLVNLFPAKIDLKPFIDAWGNAATFHLSGPNGGFRFCRPDVSTEAAWAYQTNDVYTTTGQPMSSATLTAVPEDGVGIESVSCLGTDNVPGVLAFEAVREIYSFDSLELQVKVGGETLFRYWTPWSLSSVRAMYRWRYTPGYGFHSSVMEDITPKDAIEHPLFTPFRSEAEYMHSTNLFTIASETYRKQLRAYFLADGIPATSFAMGANEASGVVVNYNMQCQSVPGWPRRKDNRDQWFHSDLKNIAFYYVNSLFLKIVGEIQ